MSSSCPPQLQLSLPTGATSFKRSFEEFGFDLDSPSAAQGSLSDGITIDGNNSHSNNNLSNNPHTNGGVPLNGGGVSSDGNDRSKRARSENSSSSSGRLDAGHGLRSASGSSSSASSSSSSPSSSSFSTASSSPSSVSWYSASSPESGAESGVGAEERGRNHHSSLSNVAYAASHHLHPHYVHGHHNHVHGQRHSNPTRQRQRQQRLLSGISIPIPSANFGNLGGLISGPSARNVNSSAASTSAVTLDSSSLVTPQAPSRTSIEPPRIPTPDLDDIEMPEYPLPLVEDQEDSGNAVGMGRHGTTSATAIASQVEAGLTTLSLPSLQSGDYLQIPGLEADEAEGRSGFGLGLESDGGRTMESSHYGVLGRRSTLAQQTHLHESSDTSLLRPHSSPTAVSSHNTPTLTSLLATRISPRPTATSPSSGSASGSAHTRSPSQSRILISSRLSPSSPRLSHPAVDPYASSASSSSLGISQRFGPPPHTQSLGGGIHATTGVITSRSPRSPPTPPPVLPPLSLPTLSPGDDSEEDIDDDDGVVQADSGPPRLLPIPISPIRASVTILDNDEDDRDRRDSSGAGASSSSRMVGWSLRSPIDEDALAVNEDEEDEIVEEESSRVEPFFSTSTGWPWPGRLSQIHGRQYARLAAMGHGHANGGEDEEEIEAPATRAAPLDLEFDLGALRSQRGSGRSHLDPSDSESFVVVGSSSASYSSEVDSRHRLRLPSLPHHSRYQQEYSEDEHSGLHHHHSPRPQLGSSPSQPRRLPLHRSSPSSTSTYTLDEQSGEDELEHGDQERERERQDYRTPSLLLRPLSPISLSPLTEEGGAIMENGPQSPAVTATSLAAGSGSGNVNSLASAVMSAPSPSISSPQHQPVLPGVNAVAYPSLSSSSSSLLSSLSAPLPPPPPPLSAAHLASLSATIPPPPTAVGAALPLSWSSSSSLGQGLGLGLGYGSASPRAAGVSSTSSTTTGGSSTLVAHTSGLTSITATTSLSSVHPQDSDTRLRGIEVRLAEMEREMTRDAQRGIGIGFGGSIGTGVGGVLSSSSSLALALSGSGSGTAEGSSAAVGGASGRWSTDQMDRMTRMPEPIRGVGVQDVRVVDEDEEEDEDDDDDDEREDDRWWDWDRSGVRRDPQDQREGRGELEREVGDEDDDEQNERNSSFSERVASVLNVVRPTSPLSVDVDAWTGRDAEGQSGAGITATAITAGLITTSAGAGTAAAGPSSSPSIPLASTPRGSQDGSGSSVGSARPQRRELPVPPPMLMNSISASSTRTVTAATALASRPQQPHRREEPPHLLQVDIPSERLEDTWNLPGASVGASSPSRSNASTSTTSGNSAAAEAGSTATGYSGRTSGSGSNSGFPANAALASTLRNYGATSNLDSNNNDLGLLPNVSTGTDPFMSIPARPWGWRRRMMERELGSSSLNSNLGGLNSGSALGGMGAGFGYFSETSSASTSSVDLSLNIPPPTVPDHNASMNTGVGVQSTMTRNTLPVSYPLSIPSMVPHTNPSNRPSQSRASGDRILEYPMPTSPFNVWFSDSGSINPDTHPQPHVPQASNPLPYHSTSSSSSISLEHRSYARNLRHLRSNLSDASTSSSAWRATQAPRTSSSQLTPTTMRDIIGRRRPTVEEIDSDEMDTSEDELVEPAVRRVRRSLPQQDDREQPTEIRLRRLLNRLNDAPAEPLGPRSRVASSSSTQVDSTSSSQIRPTRPFHLTMPSALATGSGSVTPFGSRRFSSVTTAAGTTPAADPLTGISRRLLGSPSPTRSRSRAISETLGIRRSPSPDVRGIWDDDLVMADPGNDIGSTTRPPLPATSSTHSPSRMRTAGLRHNSLVAENAMEAERQAARAYLMQRLHSHQTRNYGLFGRDPSPDPPSSSERSSLHLPPFGNGTRPDSGHVDRPMDISLPLPLTPSWEPTLSSFMAAAPTRESVTGIGPSQPDNPPSRTGYLPYLPFENNNDASQNTQLPRPPRDPRFGRWSRSIDHSGDVNMADDSDSSSIAPSLVDTFRRNILQPSSTSTSATRYPSTTTDADFNLRLGRRRRARDLSIDSTDSLFSLPEPTRDPASGTSLVAQNTGGLERELHQARSLLDSAMRNLDDAHRAITSGARPADNDVSMPLAAGSMAQSRRTRGGFLSLDSPSFPSPTFGDFLAPSTPSLAPSHNFTSTTFAEPPRNHRTVRPETALGLPRHDAPTGSNQLPSASEPRNPYTRYQSSRPRSTHILPYRPSSPGNASSTGTSNSVAQPVRPDHLRGRRPFSSMDLTTPSLATPLPAPRPSERSSSPLSSRFLPAPPNPQAPTYGGIDPNSFFPGPFRNTLQRLVQDRIAASSATQTSARGSVPGVARPPSIPPLPFEADRASTSFASNSSASSRMDVPRHNDALFRDAYRATLAQWAYEDPPNRRGEPRNHTSTEDSTSNNTRAEETRRRDMHRHFERRNRIEATRVANPDDSGDDGDAGRFHHAIEALRDGPNNPTRSRQLIDRFHQDRASSAADTSRRNSSSNWGSILDDDWTSGLEAFGARRHRFPRATPRATPNRYSRWGRSDFSLRAVGDYVRDEDFDTSYEGLMSLTAALGEVKPKNTPDKVVEEMEAAHYKDWATTESDRRCPICLDDYQPSDPVLKLNNCSHWLHQECLKQWLRGANTCPVCRKNVKIPSSSPRPPPRPGPSRRRDDHDPSGPGGSGSGRGNSSRLQPPYSIFFSWGDSDSP